MPDCVLDATVVAYANGNLTGRRHGNILDRRLVIIEMVGSGDLRLRYNSKLLGEYEQLIKDRRNDVIEVFFAVLDSERAVRVRRNALSRQNHVKATTKCRWPVHDQHLIAAAIDGDEPSLFVTEKCLADCAAKIWAHFAVRVERVA